MNKNKSSNDEAAQLKNIILRAENIHKSFIIPDAAPLHILRGVNIEVRQGEMVSLLGRSGSGKTTLLHILGLLDKPDNGRVIIDGVDYSNSSNSEKADARAHKIGFVFQFHYLLKELNALENVMIPGFIAGKNANDIKDKAMGLLEKVGLSHRLKHFPSELSGGERQRVAIARALMNDPKILIADEPTGSLDPQTADQVFDLIRELCQKHNLSALIVTHSHSLADKLDRKITLL